MSLKMTLSSPVVRILARILLPILFILALMLRVSLYHIQTSDYNFFVSQWYDYIQTHNGFAALRYEFANYNVPYLYLIAILTYLPIPKLIALKSLSVAFDLVLGLFTYLIIGLKYPRFYAAIIGALVVLFAPTIFINSAAWGQCDAIYTAFCLGSLYFLLKDRPAWACVFFGLALAFKLQAIFFAPIFLIVLLRKKMPLQHLVLIPAIFLLLLLPSFIAGRDIGSLLSIYSDQITTGGVGGGVTTTFHGGGGRFNGAGNGGGGDRQGPPPNNGGAFGGQNNGGHSPFNGNGNQGGGQYNGGQRAFNGGGGRHNGGGPRGGMNGDNFSSSALTYNAASFYQWLPNNLPGFWKWIGIALAGLSVGGVALLVWKSQQPLTKAILLKIALTFALLIPFFLPEMHERYFYLADVLSIIYAFYFPRYFYVPVIMQASSLIAYAPYMLNQHVISLSYASFGVLLLSIIVIADLVMTLYPDIRRKTVERELVAETPTAEFSDAVLNHVKQ
jgi:Gpi18-like mannosyltransferase